MRNQAGRGGAATTARTFCRHVLAGTPPGALPPTPVERAEVLALLRAHRLLGLWRVEHPDGGWARLPRGGWEETVAAEVTRQALQGVLTVEAAERARHSLEAAGFQVLAFKGVGLLRSGVYPDTRARAVGDADLLVRGGDVQDAVAVLQSAGFTPWVPWRRGRDAWLPACAFTDREAPPEMDVTLDLHWRIPYGSYRSGDEKCTEELWEGADESRGLPSAEVQALLTAEHFVRHLRVVSHLVGIADLVRLLPRIREPGRLRRLADRRRSLRILQRVLWFLGSELQVRLDPTLVEAVAVPRRLRTWTARALRLERLLGVSGGRRQGRIGGLLTEGLLRASPREALRELLDVVDPPVEWLARRAAARGRSTADARREYHWELVRWAVGRGASPLSPNQEFEGPTGRH